MLFCLSLFGVFFFVLFCFFECCYCFFVVFFSPWLLCLSIFFPSPYCMVAVNNTSKKNISNTRCFVCWNKNSTNVLLHEECKRKKTKKARKQARKETNKKIQKDSWKKRWCVMHYYSVVGCCFFSRSLEPIDKLLKLKFVKL